MKMYFMDKSMEKIIRENFPIGDGAENYEISFKKLNRKYKLGEKYFQNLPLCTYSVNWWGIATSFCLSENFIRLYYNELIKYSFGIILQRNNISLDFIREYKDTFTTENWVTILYNCWVVTKYLRTKELRYSFWREFSDYIDDVDDIDRCVSKVKMNKKYELGRVQRYCKKNNII